MQINNEQLFAFLKQPKSFIEIARKFNITFNENAQLSSYLSHLLESHLIFKNHKGLYFSPKILSSHIGVFHSTQKGFGFVELKDHQNSVFIPAKFTSSAQDYDEVKINVFQDELKPDKTYGVVTKVISRKLKFLIGKVIKNGDYFDFEPYNSFKNEVFFRWVSTKNLVLGEFVKVEILEYQKKFLKIALVQNIANENEKFWYLKVPIVDSGVEVEFNSNIEEELKQIPDAIETIEPNRVDLRSSTIVTIDGDDTKDFDDAISVEKLENNNYKLGVHIADVSYYVKEDTFLDDEAATRGTSIYLPNMVIPMLPEKLSNGICSLNPNLDRYTITMEAEIDKYGNNLSVKIYPSVINSKVRLTYNQVNKYYENQEISFTNEVKLLLDDALELAKILRKYKENQGYVNLEIEETKVILDEEGYTKDLQIKKSGISEALIEDFMVRANENVSEFLAKRKFPVIYRIHDKPDIERIEEFNGVLKSLGVNVVIPYQLDSKSFADAVEKIKEQRLDNFIKIMILRTMQKAVYSPVNHGHFGLASKFYSHFTSPIRRYPDLLLHRIIRHFLFEHKKDLLHFERILEFQSKSTSELEQRAQTLERKVVSIKKTEYFSSRIGQKYRGQITSIKKFGFFVELENNVDVLVHISDLQTNEQEEFILSDDSFTLANKFYKYQLGQFVEIEILSIDIPFGKISAKVVLKN
ncbi:ribonuclease R [Mesomycoplasma hyorhinis]|uniref:ribonuclease R n=1 Tax=Mesomycoplasma hyorhinis TaxID=2100 RepID=UPI0011B8314E|nr:ribonuclease R [Mesomycoplasma hyorhinis]